MGPGVRGRSMAWQGEGHHGENIISSISLV